MKTLVSVRKALRGGAALQALALLGAGVGMATMAAPLAAQDYTTGAISGSVTGDNGAVGGAQVTLHSQSQGQTRTLVASASGSFSAAGLTPGTYDVTVHADGFRDYADTLTIAAAQESRVTLLLTSASAGADVVVTGSRLRQDFTKTQSGLNIDVPALASQAPIGRDITSLILLAPGVTRGVPGFSNAAGESVPSIGGSSVAENAYYINGLNITNPDTYVGSSRVPFDFYKTVDVQTGGYAAEFGRATGGVINATTKSGSNTPFMAIHGNSELASLQSRLPNIGLAGNPSTIGNLARDSNQQLSIEGGGALLKDHVFVYGLFQANDRTTKRAFPLAGTYERDESSDPFYGGKVDIYLTPTQHLEATYFTTKQTTYINDYGFAANPQFTGGTIGTATGRETQKIGGDNYVFRYTGNVTDFFQLSGAYGVSKDANDVAPSSPNSYYVLYRAATATANGPASLISTLQPFSGQTIDDTKRRFYRFDGDLRFELLGRHHIRFGMDNEDLSETKITQLNGTLPIQYDYRASPNGVRLTYERLGGAVSGRDRAFYLQDSWEPLTGLTVNLGVRDDEFNQSNLSGQQYLNFKGNFAGRAGFSYTPNNDSKFRFSGSYGRYFIPPAMNLGFRGRDNYFREYFAYPAGYNALTFPKDPVTGLPLINLGVPLTGIAGYGTTCPAGLAGAPGNPTSPAGTAACTVFGANFQDPAAAKVAIGTKATYEDEFILGARYQLNQRVSVGLQGVYRKLSRISEDTDFAPFLYNALNCDNPTAATATSCNFYSANSAYYIWNPGSSTLKVRDFANTANTVTLTGLTFPKPTRDYKAGIFDWKVADNGKWFTTGSITVSRSYGNYEGTVKSDAGNGAQTDAGSTQDYDYLGLTDYSKGILPNDHTLEIKTFAAYHLTDYLLVGTNLLFQSPAHESCEGIHPTDPNAAGYGPSSFYCAVGALSAAGTYATTAPSPRGTGIKTDWTKQVDLSVRFTVPGAVLGKHLVLRADVFNVFDAHNVVQYYVQHETGKTAAGAYVSDPLYGTPLSYQQPRFVRLGFDLAF
ncbi:TonB-dependent receptor [Sphingomonas bacterium]|uniref:TonB-dependent receptor n=1 Tax=Sphingomonas bacterium TaxID=1895847 RepID=UPI001576E773|nr:TonB-dependent receptor [Sphingomonas bacterium]